MSFFHNVRSVFKALRTTRRPSPARGRRQSAPIEPLEVRTLLAGEFTDLGALGITGVIRSSVAWGDADNDGDLDLLLTGRDSVAFLRRSCTGMTGTTLSSISTRGSPV